MTFVRFIIAIIALFTSLLYVSNIITVLSIDPIDAVTMKEDKKNMFEVYSRFRLILSIIMALTWGFLIVY